MYFRHSSNVRAFGHRFFHRFGLHCATHQIRVILISAVFITSLLYPALAIYSSSQPQFLAQISTRLLDSFLATETLASYSAHRDLHDPWSGYDSLRVREDSVARARCGTQGILRVERVFIHSALPEDAGALNNQILFSTLNLEQQITNSLASEGIQCLPKQDGSCFVLSPLGFWDYNEAKLLSDTNILDTLHLSANVSVAGIPVTPHMVLAGRESSEASGSTLDFAMFLALTYIFPETDCLGNAGHSAWLRALQKAADSRDDLIAESNEPKLIALEYNGTRRSYYSALSTFSYMAYLSLVIYGYQLSRKTDKVHSKIGVLFTGMVEIVVSTVTSLSVCALAGFKITMVPWEVFPILVIFIGMENMFSLVDAIYKTPITLPVKERIAEGLSRAGTSNTLKLVLYNSILGVIAFFSVGAVRQFCAFAIVVLVAHWFLAHVFFTTVLSIDLQRLELDELLQQGTSLAPSVPVKLPPQVETKAKWKKTVLSARNLLQGRANKNITLVLLLAITGVLYYSTRPSFTRAKEPTRLAHGALSRDKPVIHDQVESPAANLWRLLNPKNDPLLHLRVESPTILIFRPDITETQPPVEQKLYHRSRWTFRTFKRFLWVLKIVLVPILATIGILYALMLYLLKDAQLLEAQHNRAEGDSPESSPLESPVDESITFTTLPRVFSNDVELVAANKTGSVVATTGTRNEFIIWRMAGEHHMHASVDVTDVLLRATTSSAASGLTAVAVNNGGTLCAVGTGAGVIAIWNIDDAHVKPLPHLSFNDASFAVIELRFLSDPDGNGNSARPSDHLLAVYDNGTAVDWTLDGSCEPTWIHPSRPSLSAKAVILTSTRRDMVAFLTEDGTLELIPVLPAKNPALEFCVAAGNPSDPVTLVHACDVEFNGRSHTLVGCATKAGSISVWDGETSELITTIDEVYGQVNNLRLSPVKSRKCSFCGELPPDTFTISFSVGQIVLVYRAYVFALGSPRKCSCPNNQPQQVPFRSAGVLAKRRSRNGSVASSGTSSPLHSRSRHHSMSGGNNTSSALFPVSGHGVHSRRVSEKDTLRRAVESMVLPIPTFDHEEHKLEKMPSLDVPLNTLCTRSSFWENLVVVRAADTTFERGKWDVINEKIVGLRRRPRVPLVASKSSSLRKLQLQPDSASGLSPASLERWELWVFDPLVSRVQASPLASLQEPQRTPDDPALKRSDIPRLPFTRVSPFVCGSSYCFAGFGNTVGLIRLGGGLARKKSNDGL